MKQMKVDAIKDGTVIDHIPAGRAVEVLGILNGRGKDPVSLGMNLSSRKYGRKDIVKIENHELSAEEVNSIALIAPSATIAIIRGYKAVDKWRVSIPKTLDNIVYCPNPNCITNAEKIASRFTLEGEDSFRCCYCEKVYSPARLKIKTGGN